MPDAELEHVQAGISGHTAGFDVFVAGDVIRVVEDVDEPRDVKREVDGLAEFVEDADEIRLGWAELPDFEVVYLYDRADDNFGYAVNVDAPCLSEWGYAPFKS